MSRTSVPRKILQITSYPPPRAGWGVRVEFLKKGLEAAGHECVVLNIGTSRRVPSTEYETVMGGLDYVRKVMRFSRRGFVAHVHVNGASAKGFVLAILAELVNLAWGRRCFLTFHAGVDQVYFPRPRYPLLLPVFWLLFAIPRRIICNSEEVKARIREYGVPAGKIVPIPAFSTQYLEFREVPLPCELERFFSAFPEVIFCYLKMRPLFFPETVIEGFARIAAARPRAGLVLCGIAGHMEGDLWPRVQARIRERGLSERVLVVEDLDHDAFLTALQRSSVYLRTHLSDGVCSSVMEALALGVPVVASENGTRPAGAIVYPAESVPALATAVTEVLENRAAIVSALARPPVRDTLREELQLLIA